MARTHLEYMLGMGQHPVYKDTFRKAHDALPPHQLETLDQQYPRKRRGIENPNQDYL